MADTVIVQASYTRPANVTAYAAGDVIADSDSAATILTFDNVVHPGGSAVIQNALLVDSANAATKLDCELYLFDTTVVMENDNAAWDPSDAELATLVGVIDFGGTPFVGGAAGGTNNCVYVAGNSAGLPIAFRCKQGVDSLFGILIARNAYTPASGEVFTIRLGILRD